MQDAALVGVVDGLGDGDHQLGGGSRAGSALGQHLLEVPPADQLHREVAPAFMLPDLVDRHDVGMIELGDRLHLVLESPQLVLRRQCSRPDHLERHWPVEADLAGRINDAHTAAAQLAHQLVVAEIAHASTRPQALVFGLSAGRDSCRGSRVGPCGLARHRREDRVDHRGMVREPAAILLCRRLLAGAAAELDLDPEQLFQELRAARFLRLGQKAPRSLAAAQPSRPARSGRPRR